MLPILMASSASLIWRDDVSLLLLAILCLQATREDILIDIDRDSRYVELATRLNNATGDLAAVCNQDLLDDRSAILA